MLVNKTTLHKRPNDEEVNIYSHLTAFNNEQKSYLKARYKGRT